MRCDEAREFVSALYDGETVPLEAAEHTAYCADCQEWLKGYADMGAALRGYGSLLTAQPVPDRTWLTNRKETSRWWEKGLQIMRIPRIAFACLVLLLVILGSRLALVEVGAHGDGSVLLLKLTTAHGESMQCYLPITDSDRTTCNAFRQFDKNNLVYSLKALKRDGDRVLLSLRYRITPPGPGGYGPDTQKTLPETQSWFTPGATLSLPNTGELKLALTGEWADHIPVMTGGNQLLDPGPNEIRLTSPLLLKNNQVAGDYFDSSAVDDGPDAGVWFYIKGEGRFLLSSAPMQGADPAEVKFNRVSFESDGQKYIIVTGTPVTREKNIWVLHDAAWKPEKMHPGVLGAGPVSKLIHN
jgi:hypothetical protein